MRLSPLGLLQFLSILNAKHQRKQVLAIQKIHEKHKPAKINATSPMQDYSEKYLYGAKIHK